jgi:hypothetical protein
MQNSLVGGVDIVRRSKDRRQPPLVLCSYRDHGRRPVKTRTICELTNHMSNHKLFMHEHSVDRSGSTGP